MGLLNLFKPEAPAVPATPVESTTPDTPPLEGLDKWGGLVENEESGTSPEKSTEVFDPVAILKDPEALERISASLDFTSSISAETQQKLADSAPDALTSLVNDVGKAAYLQAIQHSSALSQQHVADRFNQQQTVTKGDIMSGISDYELEQALPEIKNPIIKLGIESFIGKVKEQNPSISGKGIADEVRGYLKEMHNAINSEAKTPEADKKSKEIDWLSEMGF